MQHLATTRDTVLLGHYLLVARRALILLLTWEVAGSLCQLLVRIIVNCLIFIGILMDNWLSGMGMCWLLSMGLLLLTGNLLICHLLLMLNRLLLILLFHLKGVL